LYIYPETFGYARNVLHLIDIHIGQKWATIVFVDLDSII